MSPPTTKSAKSNLIYGDSGLGKTTQLYIIAKWLWDDFKIKTRLITGDGGGYDPFVESGLVEDEIVQVYEYKGRHSALAEIRAISEGYWPKWNNKVGDWKVERSPEYATDFSKSPYQCYMVEGVTTVSEQLLDHLSEKQDDTGFKHSWTINEGDYFVGGLQEGHYGLVQREIHKLIVNRFGKLPVKHIFWTAHMEKGKDREDNSVYGPKSAGRADTSRITSWFGDSLHLDKEIIVVVEKGVEKEITTPVAWFMDHEHKDTGIKILAKSRLIIDLRDKLSKAYPAGFVPLIENKKTLAGYYKRVNKWTEEFRTELRKGNESNGT